MILSFLGFFLIIGHTSRLVYGGIQDLKSQED